MQTIQKDLSGFIKCKMIPKDFYSKQQINMHANQKKQIEIKVDKIICMTFYEHIANILRSKK